MYATFVARKIDSFIKWKKINIFDSNLSNIDFRKKSKGSPLIVFAFYLINFVYSTVYAFFQKAFIHRHVRAKLLYLHFSYNLR